jgi:hypothetical protein
MTFSSNRLLLLAAAVAVGPALTQPAAAQSGSNGGVSITIRKSPSYLNTRTVARPATMASYETSALYQSGMPTRAIGFTRWPLPSTFDLGR